MKSKSKNPALTAGSMDHDWQAEDDMRTLIRAKEIERDKKRLAAAKAMARKKLAEKRKEADDMASLAGNK